MGNSYTRQSAGTIVNGQPILATDLNNEFNKLQDAFDGTAGHNHTGAVGDGQKIPLTTSVTGVLPVANGGTNGLLPVSNGGTGQTSISGIKTALAIDNVNNTSDVNKPISTATQTALTNLDNSKVPNTRTVAGKALSSDVSLVKADVGLGNVDNTSDVNKPVSTAQGAINATKVNRTGDTMSGPLTSMVVDHPNTLGTETFDYNAGNTHQITVNGALTINPTNLVAGGVLTIDILYTSGSIIVSGTTYWELGGTNKSTNIADIGATLVPGNPYRIVLKLVKGLRTGVFQ